MYAFKMQFHILHKNKQQITAKYNAFSQAQLLKMNKFNKFNH